MAKPAKDAKLKAQQVWPGASVVDRGKGSIKHQHPTNPNRFMLDMQVGGRGWHFGDGPFTEEHEVDTAWVDADPILDAPWQKKMVLADYNAYAFREPTLGFDQGQLIEYRDPVSGETVNFQPTQLQWTNDLGQLSPIEDPQAVSATVDDDMITWVGAYGLGIDFQWQTQTARLMKYVNINSLAELGAPPAFILAGGNPVLRVELLFQKSAGLEIWYYDPSDPEADSSGHVLWDEASNNPKTTLNNVEFRAGGVPVWYFKAPKAWDSGREGVSPSMRLRTSAQNLFVSIRTPWSWLETATYPVVVDATIDEQVGAGSDDCDEPDGTGITDITDLEPDVYGSNQHAGVRFTTIGLDGSETINAGTYLSLYIGTYTAIGCDIEGEDVDNAATFAAEQYNLSGRTPTTANVAWTATGTTDTWENSPDINSIITEIIARTGWSEDNAIAILLTFTTGGDFSFISYDGSTANAPKLHIDYTVAGGIFAALADTVGITDSLTNARGIVVDLAEAVGITDILSKIGTFIRGLTESVGITDVIATSVGRVVALADSVGITDIINAFILEGAKFVSIVDTVGITDIVTTSRNIIKLLFDNVGVTDILSTAREIIKLISEAVGITDTLDRSAGRFVSFVESVGVTDILSRSAGRLIFLIESVGVTDALLTARNIIRSLSDSIGLTDSLSTARNLVRSISDSIGITDTIVAIRGVLVSLSDVVGITDTLSAIAALFIKTVLFLKSLLGIVLKQRSQVSTDVTLISRISTTIALISRIEKGAGIMNLISGFEKVMNLISRIEKGAEE